jgi:hypothetical protein
VRYEPRCGRYERPRPWPCAVRTPVRALPVVLVRVDPKQARQEKDARRQAHEAALLGRTDRG